MDSLHCHHVSCPEFTNGKKLKNRGGHKVTKGVEKKWICFKKEELVNCVRCYWETSKVKKGKYLSVGFDNTVFHDFDKSNFH